VLVVKTDESGNDVNCGDVESVELTVSLGKLVESTIVDDDVVVISAFVSEIVEDDADVVRSGGVESVVKTDEASEVANCCDETSNVVVSRAVSTVVTVSVAVSGEEFGDVNSGSVESVEMLMSVENADVSSNVESDAVVTTLVSEVVDDSTVVWTTVVVLVVRADESGNDVNCGDVGSVELSVSDGKLVETSIVDDDSVVVVALVSEDVVDNSTVV